MPNKTCSLPDNERSQQSSPPRSAREWTLFRTLPFSRVASRAPGLAHHKGRSAHRPRPIRQPWRSRERDASDRMTAAKNSCGGTLAVWHMTAQPCRRDHLGRAVLDLEARVGAAHGWVEPAGQGCSAYHERNADPAARHFPLHPLLATQRRRQRSGRRIGHRRRAACLASHLFVWRTDAPRCARDRSRRTRTGARGCGPQPPGREECVRLRTR